MLAFAQMRIFGLTGGIASGKSTVAARFRARGLAVLDADQVAREVVLPGSDGLREIVEAFGPEVLLATGALDRKALASRVFANDAARATLNHITHPRVSMRALEHLEALRARGDALACYEVPLLFENHLEDGLRPVVLVAVSRETQVRRVMERDGLSREEAEARLRAQLSLEEKRTRADVTIDNDTTLEALLAAADSALDDVCDRLQITHFAAAT